MTVPSPTAPRRRRDPYKIGAVVIAVIAAAGAFALVSLDADPPDDADFVLHPRDVAAADNGLALLAGVSPPVSDLPGEDLERLYLHISPVVPRPADWDTAFAQRLLDDSEEALGALDRALGLPEWDATFANLDDAPLGVPQVHALTRTKALAAYQAAALDRHADAVRHVGDLHRIADRTARARAGLLGLMLASATHTRACQIAGDITPDINAREDLETLLEILTGAQAPPVWWEEASRTEYRLIKEAIGAGRAVIDAFHSDADFSTKLLFKPNLTAHDYLKLYSEFARYPQATTYGQSQNAVARSMKGGASSWTEILNLNLVGRAAVSSSASLLVGVEGNYWRLRFWRSRARLLIALRLYQLDHQDQLPPSLDDLVPAYLQNLPADPYDGAPLRYDPQRRLIWSAGENLTDDGGRLDPSEPHRPDWQNPTFAIPEPTTPAPTGRRPP